MDKDHVYTWVIKQFLNGHYCPAFLKENINTAALPQETLRGRVFALGIMYMYVSV